MNEIERNNSQLVSFGEWIVRVWRPKEPSSNRIILLIHGYTGDENSMTIFTRNLPSDAWIFSPRGLFRTGEGGYKWISSQDGLTASFKEFQGAVHRLKEGLLTWMETYHIQDSKIDVAGFSQGAVMSLTYALTFPESVHRAAGISGFLPRDTFRWVLGTPLVNVPVFLAHGTEDETVSFERAREAETLLETLGATITFCEGSVGHRISANCFRTFADFFARP